MKKKIKDVTLGEIIDICNKAESCTNCPLRPYVRPCPSELFIVCPAGMYKGGLEQEVEIDE